MILLHALACAAVVPPPKMSPPAGLTAPTPRPLQMTRPAQEQLPGLISGGAALAVRLATGVFTLGWSPKILTGDDAASVGVESGVYGFKLGPLAFRDTSPLLEAAPRPSKPLILYEYEGSPFCRKVREAALLAVLRGDQPRRRQPSRISHCDCGLERRPRCLRGNGGTAG